MSSPISQIPWINTGTYAVSRGRTPVALTTTAPTQPGVIQVSRLSMGAVTVVDDFVLETTEPNATNAGLLPGWSASKIYTTDQKLSTGNQTFINCDFQCKVDIQSTGNYFYNCKFQGSADMVNRPCVYGIAAGCNNGPQNFFERCLFRPQNPNITVDCIMAFNYRTLRCEMTLGVDGSGSNIPTAIGSDCRILRQGDYVHDLFYGSPDSSHSDNHSHNDCNQHHSGSNITFQGCSIRGYWSLDVGLNQDQPGVFDTSVTGGKLLSGNCNDRGGAPSYTMGAYGYGKRNVNACIQVNQTLPNKTDDIHLLGNWFYGGASTINIADTGLSMTTFEIRNNRFEVPLYGRNGVVTAYKASSAIIQASGNTYMDGSSCALTVGNGRNNQT